MPPGSPSYKSDASHLPNADIIAEDVPSRILHLVEAIFQVIHMLEAYFILHIAGTLTSG